MGDPTSNSGREAPNRHGAFETVYSALFLIAFGIAFFDAVTALTSIGDVPADQFIVIFISITFVMFQSARMYYNLHNIDTAMEHKDKSHFSATLSHKHADTDRILRLLMALVLIAGIKGKIPFFEFYGGVTTATESAIAAIYLAAKSVFADSELLIGAAPRSDGALKLLNDDSMQDLLRYPLTLALAFVLLILWDVNIFRSRWSKSREAAVSPTDLAGSAASARDFFYIRGSDGALCCRVADYFVTAKFFERTLGLLCAAFGAWYIVDRNQLVLLCSGFSLAGFALILIGYGPKGRDLLDSLLQPAKTIWEYTAFFRFWRNSNAEASSHAGQRLIEFVRYVAIFIIFFGVMFGIVRDALGH